MDAMDLGMQTSVLAVVVLFAWSLCACGHSATTTEAPPPVVAPSTPTPGDSVSESSPAPPRGKRAPCTSDQSCNRDPSVSALWGRCLKDSGVCECNAGFELHPGGYCQPIAN